MQTWEYHVIYLNLDDFQQKQNQIPIATRALNRLGEQGWESYAVVDMDTSRKALLFKRPKQEQTKTAAQRSGAAKPTVEEARHAIHARRDPV